MNKTTIVFLLLLTTLLSAKNPCRGLSFHEDPFNKDKKSVSIPLLRNNRIQSNLNLIYDDKHANFILIFVEEKSHTKTDIIPKGTPIRIALKNGEQIVLTTEFAVEAKETTVIYNYWELPFELTKDLLTIIASSPIAGIQLNVNNSTITFYTQYEESWKFISKVCNCFKSFELLETSTKNLKHNDKKSNEESNSDI